MSVVKAIFSNFFTFLMCIIITAIPYKGVQLPIIDTVEDDCKLNIEVISDVHLEDSEIFRQLFLKAALKNMSRSKANIDAMVVCGDITNYGDEPSLAKYYEILDEYSPVPVVTVAGNHDIGHVGDRDKTNITRYEALANIIKYRNKYRNRNDTTNYYSEEIKGYKFIVIGDEVDGFTIKDGQVVPTTEGHWDAITMTQAQLDFLDRELADGTKDGKPVFVCCHWPICNTNGEQTIWPDSGIDQNEYNIQAILEKYKNVFYLSGHMHAGIKAEAIDNWYGLSNAQQINGVTYINLPTFGIINSFGTPWSCTGMQLEVYGDKVIVRPRNFITNKWFVNSVFTFDLV